MRKATKIKRHYLPEWLSERGHTETTFIALINSDLREGEGIIDKSQVYRWMKGQMPQEPFQLRIATKLKIINPVTGAIDPELLQQHPSQVWLAAKVKDRDADELRRMREVLSAAFPDNPAPQT